MQANLCSYIYHAKPTLTEYADYAEVAGMEEGRNCISIKNYLGGLPSVHPVEVIISHNLHQGWNLTGGNLNIQVQNITNVCLESN